MNKRLTVPELLAPAGSFEALTAAIDSGADAVYLGGKLFGARHYAANFDKSELESAVEYAHVRNMKIYVTVNTLVLENEIPDVARYLVWLHEIGVDAVLVQDLGVIDLARKLVPELELHASTQMTIHNREGAFWAAQMGLKRAVLARELSLAEVEEIAHAVPIGIEIFIHGALCYGYSGQCLLSSVIGGRSGNRGMCAQPCRKPYELVKGKQDRYGRFLDLETIPLNEKYLMSTKDLAVYSHLDKIVKSGINALKIEGRMKSPEYVAVVVSVYRKALDAIALGEWSPSQDDLGKLALAFNRGFTKGYILGAKQRGLMGRTRSDNRGVLIGSVTSYDRTQKYVTIKLDHSFMLERGDGIVFRSPDEDVGMVVQYFHQVRKGMMQLKIQNPIPKGAQIYLTHRPGLAKKTALSRSPIMIDLNMAWEENGTPVLEGLLDLNGMNLQVSMRGGFCMVPAIRRPLTEEQIETQIRKTGGTPFCIGKIKMDYPGGLFAPIKELNNLRREFLKKIESEIVAAYRPSSEEIASAKDELAQTIQDRQISPAQFLSKKHQASISVYANTLQTVQGAVEGGCQRVYFEPMIKLGPDEKDGRIDQKDVLGQLKTAADICQDFGAVLVWKWPKITRRRYLDFASSILKKADAKVNEVMVENTGAAEAVLKAVPEMSLSGSAGLNIWNNMTVRQLVPNFRQLTISPELSAKEIADLMARVQSLKNRPKMEMIVQGNLEAMVSEDCLVSTAIGCEAVTLANESYWAVRDSTNRTFPLSMDGECRTHILNAVETCLVDHLPLVLNINVDSLAIDAMWRTKKYSQEMTEIYRKALEIVAQGGAEKDLKALKDEAKKRSRGGITTGAFLRGRR
ncbi:MAG: DUF3656 domain-containing U32 family peptidase [Methanotrichaceae archaeon]